MQSYEKMRHLLYLYREMLDFYRFANRLVLSNNLIYMVFTRNNEWLKSGMKIDKK